MTQLWLKHRPDSLAHMVGLDALKEDARGWVVYEQNNYVLRCGGVIFAGGPGTGKTSAARAIAKDTLGSNFESNYHTFNASDDRGIQFVRERLKALAQQKAINSTFKVINLDEADGLTRDAQDSLRAIIEDTCTHVLWILTCNRVARIIPALRSRLPTYTFNGLEVDEAEGFLSQIIEEEGYPSRWADSIPLLITKHKGDLRACLKTMQICDPDDADALARHTEQTTKEMVMLYNEIHSRDWDEALNVCNYIVDQGTTRDEMIDGLHQAVVESYDSNEIGVSIALRYTLVLGQWAARSANWTVGDLLFLHSIVGDIKTRVE